MDPAGGRYTFTHDAVGQRLLDQLANGTRASSTYDPASRLTAPQREAVGAHREGLLALLGARGPVATPGDWSDWRLEWCLEVGRLYLLIQKAKELVAGTIEGRIKAVPDLSRSLNRDLLAKAKAAR